MIKICYSRFARGDEGVELARLEERDSGEHYEQKQIIDLYKWFDLPKPPHCSSDVKEIYLEGIHVQIHVHRSPAGLWLVRSHSHKRGKAEPRKPFADNLKKLPKYNLTKTISYSTFYPSTHITTNHSSPYIILTLTTHAPHSFTNTPPLTNPSTRLRPIR